MQIHDISEKIKSSVPSECQEAIEFEHILACILHPHAKCLKRFDERESAKSAVDWLVTNMDRRREKMLATRSDGRNPRTYFSKEILDSKEMENNFRRSDILYALCCLFYMCASHLSLTELLLESRTKNSMVCTKLLIIDNVCVCVCVFFFFFFFFFLCVMCGRSSFFL